MVRKQHHSTLLPVPVKVAVQHDLSVNFRGMNFGLRGIPGLISKQVVTITHYDWHHNEITISVTHSPTVTHCYIANSVRTVSHCA
ncbi:hypothetical protein GYD00_001187 [Salmonella enterica]|nr:hypothetical protein [Salmonella enterica subsp. enterica serovar Panama]EEI5905250.1 hypothetical protein [Salmonella enterica]EEQ0726791.1 hypothetical protein [Salmonella enterica]EHZ6191203.1 hypothetical protein [Salmonella enterica]